jgi:hypothetical protein
MWSSWGRDVSEFRLFLEHHYFSNVLTLGLLSYTFDASKHTLFHHWANENGQRD